jgi:hypothetical protein
MMASLIGNNYLQRTKCVLPEFVNLPILCCSSQHSAEYYLIKCWCTARGRAVLYILICTCMALTVWSVQAAVTEQSNILISSSSGTPAGTRHFLK